MMMMFVPPCADVVLLQDVIRVHTGRKSRVVVRQVQTGDDDTMRAILRELRIPRISKFFVHLSSTDTALFLKAVVCKQTSILERWPGMHTLFWNSKYGIVCCLIFSVHA